MTSPRPPVVPSLVLSALIAGSAASCATSQPPGCSSPTPEAASWAVFDTVSEPTLYARDGTPVRGGPAVGEPGGPPAHVVQEGGSRMYLLELYQEVVDRKEALELEVEALGAELERSRASLASREKDLAATEARRSELEEQNAALARENVDLAGRLVTAQIRRLEAEKLLLEAKLEWLRTRNLIEAAATQTNPSHGERP